MNKSLLVIQKLKDRLRQFKQNPVTRRHVNKAMLNYIKFNLMGSFRREIKYNWVHDLKFLARKGDAGIVPNIYFGIHEFYESLFTCHFLRNHDTFLDVGANLGHYSLLASGVKGCHSLAVEPVPSVYKQLLRQIELNSLDQKITPMNIGVSNESSEYYFSQDKGVMNRVVPHDHPGAIKIGVKKLDEICGQGQVNLMKIDVEGFEKFALQGASGILNSNCLKAIILELNGSGLKYGVSDQDVFNFLKGFKFAPYRYDPLSRKLTLLENYNQEQFNTIFIRDQEFVNDRLRDSKPVEVWGRSI